MSISYRHHGVDGGPTDGAMEQINENCRSRPMPTRARDEGTGAVRHHIDAGENSLYDWGGSVKVKAGPINGPVPARRHQPYNGEHFLHLLRR